MARATSLNAEIVIDGVTEPIYPLEISEVGEGEEGRLDVADGGRKYKVRDQIFDIGEVAVTILFTRDRSEYDVMQEWCISGAVRDAYINYRDSAGNIRLQYALYNCECAMGKFHGFNRNSKEVDTKKYVLLPTEIEDITAAAVAPDVYVRPAQ
jgi:hypothetical protein